MTCARRHRRALWCETLNSFANRAASRANGVPPVESSGHIYAHRFPADGRALALASKAGSLPCDGNAELVLGHCCAYICRRQKDNLHSSWLSPHTRLL
mmetsp:Transcript_45165/g.61238  ORF Transcript_45165/g.61238 Transcript_45165/m.61238 type:complete len:98 (+) Transcript_45165:33-326(+)